MSLQFKKLLEKNPKAKPNVGKTCIGPSKTRQEFKKDCDINRIVDRYTRTGELPFIGRKNLGIYADVSQIPDYKSALEFVIAAKESFSTLDVNIRKRFHNSPDELMAFLEDPNNKDEARKLGLIPAEKPIQAQIDENKAESLMKEKSKVPEPTPKPKDESQKS